MVVAFAESFLRWSLRIWSAKLKTRERTFDLMVGTSTGGILALGLSLEGEGGAPLFNAEDGQAL